MKDKQEKTEKMEKLRMSIEHDRQRIKALQEGVAEKEKKYRQMEMAEIEGKLNLIRADKMNVLEIVDAIQRKDLEALMTLMEGDEKNESGDELVD
ncbi:MAG: hypothetical protein U0N62_03210 [Hydrogeniiclostridium sp.]